MRLGVLPLLLLASSTGCFGGLDDHLLTGASSPGMGGQAPGGGPATGCDNFAADAVGALPAGWAVSGGSWKIVAVGAEHALGQTTPMIAKESISTNAANDVVITATVLPPEKGSVCLQARYLDRQNHYTYCVDSGTSWTFYVLKGNVPTTLASGTQAYDQTKPHTLALAAKGNQMTMQLDGVTLRQLQDGTFPTGMAALATSDVNSFSPVCLGAP
jgi:hypothetical protein